MRKPGRGGKNLRVSRGRLRLIKQNGIAGAGSPAPHKSGKEKGMKYEEYINKLNSGEEDEIISAVRAGDFARLVELSGLNASGFARKFGLSLRTLQNWIYGERKPPEYIIKLLGFAVMEG